MKELKYGGHASYIFILYQTSFTIGTQKSQSNSASYTEVNQASNITSNNLALIATGDSTNSNINVNGSNLNVSNDALFQADNDFNVNGVAQNSNTRSTNSSSSTAIGGFADTRGSAGITANASRGKGYANSDSVTYANSQLNIGGTTTYDIGNDFNIKGGVINTGRAQGVIGGNVNIESLQDTSTYDSNQKNTGFSADIDIAGGGAGSSLSVNGSKTDINADYKAVGQQSGIFTGDGGFDLDVGGKTTLIGGAITTTDAAVVAGRNNYTSLGGIATQDIENTTSYEGDAIQVGVSLGNTTGKPQATMNGLGYGTDGDSDSSVTRAGITGIAGNSGITTDNQAEYAGALENVFDEQRVNEELGAQTQITKEFGKEAPKAVGDASSYMQLEMVNKGNVDAADKWAEGGAYRVALHTLVGAIATGSVDGALASGTTAVSIPAVGRYLEKQGVDETTKGALLLGLSAGVGAVVGGDTASAASSVNQTQNNYLNHIENAKLNELLAKKERMTGKGKIRLCNRSAECRAELASINKDIKVYEDLSAKRDADFNVAYNNCRRGAGCKTFYGLHVTQRQEWNAGAIKSFKDNRGDWVLQGDDKNIFHNFDKNGQPAKLDKGYRYKKYVHNNGQLEIVIDTKDGVLSPDDYSRIVTDPTNAGSYNYYIPIKGIRGIPHKDYDVDPYIDFGSGNSDRTTLNNRRNVPINDYVDSDTIFGELPPVLGMEGSIANKLSQAYIDRALEDFEKEKK